MLAPFLLSFLVLFVVILIAVTVASKFWDNKRKKQVSSMLKTASGEERSEISISNLLMEPSEDGRSFMERFIEGLDIAQKLQTKMTQELERAVDELIGIIKNKHTEDRDKIAAIKLLMERVMGKVPDTVDLRIADKPKWAEALTGGIVSVEEVEDAELVEE